MSISDTENAIANALNVKMEATEDTNRQLGSELLGYVKTVEEDLTEQVNTMKSSRRYSDPMRQELFLKEQILMSAHSDLKHKIALQLQEMHDLTVTVKNIRSVIADLDSDKYRSQHIKS